MLITEAKEIVDKHNREVDDYTKYVATVLGDGKEIPLSSIFTAWDMIKSQNFYKKGVEIIHSLRKEGYECKINAQTEKLILGGKNNDN